MSSSSSTRCRSSPSTSARRCVARATARGSWRCRGPSSAAVCRTCPSDASGGYPYFLQQFGKAAWDIAAGPDVVTAEDATIGITDGQRQLDTGFYASRWERATKAERELLRTMAADDGVPSSIGDVVARLGKSDSRSIGPARASLIAKGIAFAPEHGVIAYSVPGMAAYVARRDGG